MKPTCARAPSLPCARARCARQPTTPHEGFKRAKTEHPSHIPLHAFLFYALTALAFCKVFLAVASAALAF